MKLAVIFIGLAAGLSSNNNDIGKQAKGFYRRPSAAIERGGGFFIPGLEGGKLRFLTSAGLLALTVANHGTATASSAGPALTVSEICCVAAVVGLLTPYLVPPPKEETLRWRRNVRNDCGIAVDDIDWAATALARATRAKALLLVKDRRTLLLTATTADSDLVVTTFDSDLFPQGDDEKILLKRRRDNLFTLLPRSCGYAAVIPCHGHPGHAWILGLTDPDDLLPQDARFCARLLRPTDQDRPTSSG